MKSLLYLLTLLPLVLGIHDIPREYTFSSTLYDQDGDTYVLHWNFNATKSTISFAVNVSTTGWVGFGISPNGGMVNSDVVIGWVSNGRAYFHVSFVIADYNVMNFYEYFALKYNYSSTSVYILMHCMMGIVFKNVFVCVKR